MKKIVLTIFTVFICQSLYALSFEKTDLQEYDEISYRVISRVRADEENLIFELKAFDANTNEKVMEQSASWPIDYRGEGVLQGLKTGFPGSALTLVYSPESIKEFIQVLNEDEGFLQSYNEAKSYNNVSCSDDLSSYNAIAYETDFHVTKILQVVCY